MKTNLNSLKQAEMFALLAIFFLLMIGRLESPLQDVPPSPRPSIEPSPSPSPSASPRKYPETIPIPSKDLSFESGKALPHRGSDYLRNYIKDKIVPQIEEQLKRYDVDMIEVVGHTDGQRVGRSGNLDQKELNELAKQDVNKIKFDTLVKNFENLTAGSNADLGLIRALIVVKTLQDLQKTGECECKVKAFRAYSAAQLYLPGNDPEPAPYSRKKKPERRRIEIRLGIVEL